MTAEIDRLFKNVIINSEPIYRNQDDAILIISPHLVNNRLHIQVGVNGIPSLTRTAIFLEDQQQSQSFLGCFGSHGVFWIHDQPPDIELRVCDAITLPDPGQINKSSVWVESNRCRWFLDIRHIKIIVRQPLRILFGSEIELTIESRSSQSSRMVLINYSGRWPGELHTPRGKEPIRVSASSVEGKGTEMELDAEVVMEINDAISPTSQAPTSLVGGQGSKTKKTPAVTSQSGRHIPPFIPMDRFFALAAADDSDTQRLISDTGRYTYDRKADEDHPGLYLYSVTLNDSTIDYEGRVALLRDFQGQTVELNPFRQGRACSGKTAVQLKGFPSLVLKYAPFTPDDA